MYQSCWSDMSQPLSYLSIKIFYHIVFQCISHSEFSFYHFAWCRKLQGILFFYREVRKHMTAGLLTSTKSLCCSWSFVVLSSPSAATELRNLCSNSARNHDNFTALCQQCTDEAGSGPLLGSWVSEMSHKIFVWLKGLHFVLVISSLHFLLQEAFTWTQ